MEAISSRLLLNKYTIYGIELLSRATLTEMGEKIDNEYFIIYVLHAGIDGICRNHF